MTQTDILTRADVRRVAAAFRACTSEQEVLSFMRDIMTEKEIQECAHRLTAASMLTAGKGYDEIAAATDMSTTTIARVSTWLKHGKGGYAAVLKKIAS
jgi:TrpR-related protein YerC/YecD